MRILPLLSRVGVALLALATTIGAEAANLGSVSYVPTNFSTLGAFLVDWQAHSRAHLGSNFGGGDGAWQDDGSIRVLTMDTPFSVTIQSFDCNGNAFLQRADTAQFAFRRESGNTRRGLTSVIELGTITDLGGCTPGQVTPFGALTDAGLATNHLSMAARPPITDLASGARLAGMTEGDIDPNNAAVDFSAQIVAFGTGMLTFESTADVYATQVIDGWIQFTLPAGVDRRYTRLSQDRASGVQAWLASDYVGGRPGYTWQALMTRPNAKAGFGTLHQSAHIWSSGLLLGSTTGLDDDLWSDLTGQRVLANLDGTFTTQPLTWAPSGANIVTTRVVGSSQRVRTWVPVANVHRNHFVLEEETWFYPDGSTFQPIVPRVNYYVDGGVAVKPAVPPRIGAGPAHEPRGLPR